MRVEEERALSLAQLVEDPNIYVREEFDEEYVSELADALRVGAKLPPPIVDAATLRIVDGWYRVRAMRRVLGPDAVITVIARTYASEGDVLRDRKELNARNGLRLTPNDRIRAAHLLARAGIPPEEIAAILSVPVERVNGMLTLLSDTEPNES
jgi:hypothetical protein